MSADDGFIEIEPAKAGASKAGCIVRAAMWGRYRSRHLSITFRMSELDAETVAILRAGHRWAVAFNQQIMALRIRAAAQGRFEMVVPARAGGNVLILRVPWPRQLTFVPGVAMAVQPDPVPHDQCILIDIPLPFRAAPTVNTPRRPGLLAAPQARDVTAEVMGDPPPGRSALNRRGL